MSTSDSEKKCDARYIGRYYANVTIITGFLLVAVLIISFLKIDTLQDYQKYIVLFSDVFFALLFIVSLIAMFREVSRLHAREFPSDTIERVNDIEKRLQTLENDKNDKEKRLQTLENDKNDKEKRLRTLENDKNDKEKRLQTLENDKKVLADTNN